jgi:uncharacterized protein YacL
LAQVIQYLTATVAVYALLLSLGGVMVVNSLRALAELQQSAWELTPDSEKTISMLPVILRFVFSSQRPTMTFGRVKTRLIEFMLQNIYFGSAGLVISLFSLAFLGLYGNPDVPFFVAAVTFIATMLLLWAQLIVFARIAWESMRVLSSYVKKLPTEPKTPTFGVK